MTNEDLLRLVLQHLEPLPVTARSMFGGKGLYFDGKFFGVIFDGVLYFRTDDESRAAYSERGMAAYQPKHRPRGPKTVDRNFEVPPDILADPALLKEWALRAAQAKR
jgi:DNA transformation protein